ncbi:uncharacterized protein [Anabrus simplex]|uniref:uncharacterized protein isoform X5 n=1 Tax=Anabrus simplex TaxID=316456 RepID=UPI0035A395E1
MPRKRKREKEKEKEEDQPVAVKMKYRKTIHPLIILEDRDRDDEPDLIVDAHYSISTEIKEIPIFLCEGPGATGQDLSDSSTSDVLIILLQRKCQAKKKSGKNREYKRHKTGEAWPSIRSTL